AVRETNVVQKKLVDGGLLAASIDAGRRNDETFGMDVIGAREITTGQRTAHVLLMPARHREADEDVLVEYRIKQGDVRQVRAKRLVGIVHDEDVARFDLAGELLQQCLHLKTAGANLPWQAYIMRNRPPLR